MRRDAIKIEESRLEGIEKIEDYQIIKERHRVFPAIFDQRKHKNILDIAAGVGCASKRIHDMYPGNLISSDISPTALKVLKSLGIPTLAFDIDDSEVSFPFPDGHFDAVISLVTIEHLLYCDHFLSEIHRILNEHGYLYISTPNYAAPEYLIQPIFRGRTFHDPLGADSKYEFYAHVRYFTYKTLLDFVPTYGFSPDTVYLALPGGSSRYQALYKSARFLALAYRSAMWLKHTCLPARLATEPIICFQKNGNIHQKLRKVVL